MLARMYVKNPPYVDKNCDEVRATPIENIVAAKELLENNQSPVALETAVKLMTKALVQEEKATSSRKLESDVALCRSSTASKARGYAEKNNHGARPDNESHTGSTEVRRREAHNRQTPSQYPLMIGHMAKANKEIPHHLTRITLLMDTTKTRPLPAIRPIFRHQNIRHSRSHREELSYATTTASGDRAVTLVA
jgi:hypothetical protein